MKELVIISGKGGAGKTSITASFGMLAGTEGILADCDVDAADMHLLMQPDFGYSEDFYSGVLPKIDNDKCVSCNRCAEVCRFDAIEIVDDDYTVLPLECEGCGYCYQVCPADAITMVEQNIGQLYKSNTKIDTPMVHAKLDIGAENSGKLVAKVKQEAQKIAKEQGLDWILVDGSPGIGCPVVSSLSGADFVVLVTEPTGSGLHDLKRVYQLVEKFKIPAGCIINKADLNPEIAERVKAYLEEQKIVHFGDLPYHKSFTEAMTAGQTIVEYDGGKIKNRIKKYWKKIKENLQEDDNE
jgi:MinD superfamily P-loop ATPase